MLLLLLQLAILRGERTCAPSDESDHTAIRQIWKRLKKLKMKRFDLLCSIGVSSVFLYSLF